jgi:Fe2+ transport system protein FeoA
MKRKDGKHEFVTVDGQCGHPDACPLSHVKAGCTVCIQELPDTPEVSNRLRELGLGEEQKIRLVSRATNIICQVCNARLGISKELAEQIMVRPMSAAKPNP